MSTLKSFLNKVTRAKSVHQDGGQRRRQVNIQLDKSLITKIKLVAISFGIPTYAFVEHLLEQALHQTAQHLKNEFIKEQFKMHLLNEHLQQQHDVSQISKTYKKTEKGGNINVN